MSDQGRYVCKASNAAGQSEAVAEVIVNGEDNHILYYRSLFIVIYLYVIRIESS